MVQPEGFTPQPAQFCVETNTALAYGDVVCTSNTWHGRAGGLPALHLLILEFVFYVSDLAFDRSAAAYWIVVLGYCRIACRAVEWLRGQDFILTCDRRNRPMTY